MAMRLIIRPDRQRRWRRAAFCLVLAITLNGCQLHPPMPLLSPVQATGEYGYADIPLGENRYQVSYVGPGQRILRSAGVRREISVAERTQAFDLATWRAAEIALGQGFAGFRVSNVQTNVDSMADDYYEPFYGPGFYPYRRFGGPFGPYWGPYGGGPSPYVYTQTQVVIDIALLQSLEAGDYDANATIDRLRRTYPGAIATSPPPAG